MNTNLTLFIATALLLLTGSRPAKAQSPLLPNSYDGAATSVAGPSTFTTIPSGGTSVVFSQVSRGAGLTAATAGNGYSSQGFNTASATAAAAVAANDFLTFTVATDPSTVLTLTSYNFVLQRSGSGPTTVQLQVATQLTGNVFSNISIPQTLTGTAAQAVNIVGVPTVIAAGDVATFRLVPYGGSPATTGTFRFVNGTSFTGTYLTTALPVTLSAFDARSVAPGHTRLEWTTEQESGATRFELEKSTDGERFAVLNTQGASNPTGGFYSFDDRAAGGDAAYRVRMVDMDGTSQLSKTIWVRGEVPVTADVRVNTIVRDALHIQSGRAFSYALLDYQGRVVRRSGAPGTGVLDVPTTDLASGPYILQLTIDGAGRKTYQVVKQ